MQSIYSTSLCNMDLNNTAAPIFIMEFYFRNYRKMAMEYVLKRVSFGSKDCTKELKLECAYFLGQSSDPLIVSKFHNETHDPKGQENKIYTILKGREMFYCRHTVPVTSCSEVKSVLKRVYFGLHQRTESRMCIFPGPD